MPWCHIILVAVCHNKAVPSIVAAGPRRALAWRWYVVKLGDFSLIQRTGDICNDRTPLYFPPELNFQDCDMDSFIDIYAMAAVLVEMCSGSFSDDEHAALAINWAVRSEFIHHWKCEHPLASALGPTRCSCTWIFREGL